MNEEDDVVLGGLRKLGLPPRSNRENPNTLGAFEYLLRMRVDRIKKSSVQKAFEELEAARADLKTLESTIASEIWSKELVEFEQAWNLHEKNMLAIMQASCSKEVGSPKKRIIRKK
jgi:hypothetical protein